MCVCIYVCIHVRTYICDSNYGLFHSPHHFILKDELFDLMKRGVYSLQGSSVVKWWRLMGSLPSASTVCKRDLDNLRMVMDRFYRWELRTLRSVYSRARQIEASVHAKFTAVCRAFRKLRKQTGLVTRSLWEKLKGHLVFRRLRSFVRNARVGRGESSDEDDGVTDLSAQELPISIYGEDGYNGVLEMSLWDERDDERQRQQQSQNLNEGTDKEIFWENQRSGQFIFENNPEYLQQTSESNLKLSDLLGVDEFDESDEEDTSCLTRAGQIQLQNLSKSVGHICDSPFFKQKAFDIDAERQQQVHVFDS